ncbi:kinase-like domain-containing protein [Tricharina praecox]|uniref:kinase-like domain-containing protein n=1 Tax=Tricharina praecox TaxID=43433 RepID=UPI00221FB8DC|nr:kinase-like domain-containing protein [Tricharina praecox]KAI5853500.1 kinase-like domain-containing protein [Tricharina praecox]
MSTPAPPPFLRPAPINSPRAGGARGVPRLGLAIPGSAPAAPANGMGPVPGRRGPPLLKLATPQPRAQAGGNVPQSATSQYSALSFAMGLRNQVRGSPNDPKPTNGNSALDDLDNKVPDENVDYESMDVELLPVEGWKKARETGRIIELGSLGEGAGGAVTRCTLRGGKTVFALKVITTDPTPEVRKQIFRELNFNRECSSPYICKYYGAFTDITSGTISIAMEFCEGGSLDSIYREVKKLGGRTGEKVLGKCAEGVLEGLTYLSARKIIHRDIKPSNILITRAGQVKLCDFGVSGELIGSKGNADTFIGTSYYMAPERIQGLSYTITSDVWSLGVTLLEVAQHRFPFGQTEEGSGHARAGLIDLLTYIVRQPIPELKDEPELGIKWSDGFKYFISCCLEKDTARRASPWRMLDHPWIMEMKHKKVNMANFLAQVWDWK